MTKAQRQTYDDLRHTYGEPTATYYSLHEAYIFLLWDGARGAVKILLRIIAPNGTIIPTHFPT